MSLRGLLWWLSDVLWLHILGGSHLKNEYRDRCKKVIEVSLAFLDSGEPYVIDGKWSWYKSSSVHHPITILFTEQPLAVQVYGPEVGSWEECRKYCKNKRAWEVANEAASTLQLVCDKIGLPLITIHWNEPIDAVSLGLKFDAIAQPETENR